MSGTNFPNGLLSFGVPVLPVGRNPYTHVYFVDGNHGADGNDGTTPDTALKTMAAAFLKLVSGDTILFKGNITEQIDTPVQIFDVSIIGAPNRPRHADATPAGGESGATWKPPAAPTAATPLLRIRQQGWRLINFLMDAPADAAAVRCFRDGGAGNAERDASHTAFLGMKILGGSIGIEDHGGVGHLWIDDCDFHDLTHAIKNTIGAGIGQPLFRAMIRNSRFRANTNHVVAGAQEAHIYDNIFGSFTTLGIDLTGGVGKNVITKNLLSGTYSIAGGYKRAAADDEWAGNFANLTGGVTEADPA
jgi:hypothetical protein